jgi:exonuclease 3'-5' domain-containing protein 1
MENCLREGSNRRYLRGLAACIEHHSDMPPAEHLAWRDTKWEGHNLFAPNRGGSYEVFNIRPLPPLLVNYCVNDVVLLPQLRQIYWSQLSDGWKKAVVEETKNRIKESQAAAYNPNCPDKKYGPWAGVVEPPV